MCAIRSSASGAHMSLWRRAPREVYRVYGEDEYLAEGAESPQEADLPHLAEPPPSRKSSSGRLVGLGLLAGVTVGTIGIVAINASRRVHVASRPGVAQSVRVHTANDGSEGRRVSADEFASSGASSPDRPSAVAPSNTKSRPHKTRTSAAQLAGSARAPMPSFGRNALHSRREVDSEPSSTSLRQWASGPSTARVSEAYVASRKSSACPPSTSESLLASASKLSLQEFGFER
jgi:hypothetical protein